MQTVSVLGSTGSIGTNALDVISRFPDRFRVSVLSTNSNVDLLSRQVKRFRPKAVCVVDAAAARRFRKISLPKIKLYEGEEGLCGMAADLKVDTLLVGIVGSSALMPILKAMANIKRLALANKEALVMAGDIIMKDARRKAVKILPVDSEHNAVFQCVESGRSAPKKIYLTGSGGPFLATPKKSFKYISPEKAVKHPRWKMGKKISVDSATMMNKGLEVIEAHHLFGLDVGNIEVLIHPETVVHSMVEFVDGSILAHMGTCDMRTPIQYALTYPSRVSSPVKGVTFSKSEALHFYSPDFKKFPCLRIAYEAARRGETYPCVLNAANEVAVGQFLKGRIKFTDIAKVIEKVLARHRGIKGAGLRDVLGVDAWARLKTKELLGVVSD